MDTFTVLGRIVRIVALGFALVIGEAGGHAGPGFASAQDSPVKPSSVWYLGHVDTPDFAAKVT